MAPGPARADSGPPVLFLGYLLLAGLAAPAPATAEGIADCRRIADATARLACYDALPGPAPTAGTPFAPDAAVPPGPPAPAGAAPLPSPVELFGRDPSSSAATLAAATGVERLDSVAATVTSAGRTADGKLTLGLDNGQQWLQVDTRRSRVASGDTVTIRRAALGSYLLTTGDGSAPIRVRRTR